MATARQFNANPTIEKLFEGFGVHEGPSFDRDGSLYTVANHDNKIVRMTPDGTPSVACETPGRPHGSTFGRDGLLYVACRPGKRIVIFDPRTDSYKVWLDRVDDQGTPFLGPNDLRFNERGELYITDPPVWTEDPEGRAKSPPGSVYRVTSDGRVHTFATGIASPNGLCFSADWKTLFVADSWGHTILTYEVLPDGSAGAKKVFVQLKAQMGSNGRPSVPDGIALGLDGNLYIAHNFIGEIDVVSPHGEVIGEIGLPSPGVSNLAFHADQLYVTSGTIGGVYRVDIGVRGLPLYAGF